MDKRVALAIGAALLAAMGTALAQDGVSFVNEGVVNAETIENVILAYEPPRMMAIKIQKPPQSFPFKEAWKNSWTVLTLTPLDAARTHVRASSLGFGTDEESVAMRRFFEAGNQ